MKFRPLGQSNISASIVGLGTWVLGGSPLWGQEPDDRESIYTLQAALDGGVNLIDTAPAYGFGRSEEVLGKALKGRRAQAVLATKCGLWWEDARGAFHAELAGKKLYRCVRPDTLSLELDRSLRRLATDYLDLYQIHWPAAPSDPTPVSDTMACLLKFKEQGKIRAIGVSNVTLDQLREYLANGPVASDQFRYSLLYRVPEKDILPFCAQNNLATLTYMSLEQGLLTGKVGMDRVFSPSEFRSNQVWNPWYIPDNRKKVLELLAGWQDLTRKYGCTLAELVIAWTAAQPGVTHCLCGTRNRSQLNDNLRAGDLTLEPADTERIRREVAALGEPMKAEGG